MVSTKHAEAVDRVIDKAVKEWVKEVGDLLNHEWGSTMNGMAEATDEDVIRLIKQEVDWYCDDYYQAHYEPGFIGEYQCETYESYALAGFAEGIRKVMIGAM